MGVSRTRRYKLTDLIPTRFALASKATSPFQGEVGADCASLHPGYLSNGVTEHPNDKHA
ncbi:hypothetical protein SAMN05444164_5409 [Bradyrhizobium erythrophlei]|uniref:Uncharacterized protein n=1 Tax=Bradyrhizobium erythrophlei TaxID=1437360 RepID=A0A1H5CKC3_9BRAD|nr:hypothetical protein SAMN05444164_5409 [Bradyrhizobium erythrophlei]